MDNNVIYHDHNGQVVKIEGDTWPSETTDIIELTNVPLSDRDIDELFFELNSDNIDLEIDIDLCDETNASVNVDLDTVFCASVTDTILIENVVPSNDDVTMFNNDTRTISVTEPAPSPTD